MDIHRILQFSDLYPELVGNKPSIEALINGLSREELIRLTSNMFLRIAGKPFYNNNLNFYKGEYDFVRFFLTGKNQIFLNDVLSRYNIASKRILNNSTNISIIATSKASILNFQRTFFSLKPSTPFPRHFKAEQDFFKALLLINEIVYDAKYDEKKHLTKPIDLQLANLYLAYNYANEDIEITDLNDLFRRQLTKSVTLFRFLYRTKDKRIKILRSRFLGYFHISHWVEYLLPHIMALSIGKFQSGLLDLKGPGKQRKKAKRVLERSCIDKNEIIPVDNNEDFKEFRSNPFIKVSRHQYAITSTSFVMEHVFNSIYFELKLHRKDAGFKSDDEFRQFYTTEFSQKFMFEGFVELCLPTITEFSISGSQCDEILDIEKKRGKNTKGVTPPDYFVRLPEGCVIFEYKDALSNAKIKESRDYEKLINEIEKKFFKKEKGSHKGVPQILDNVLAIQSESFFFDSPSKDTLIYPVLVIDNPVYTIRGMHTILEYMMRDECKKRGINASYVRPLVLMDVATLRLHADYFKSHGIINVFDDYYAYINLNGIIAQKDPFESLLSFTEYIKDKDLGNMGRVFDQLFNEAKHIIRGYK